jgi:hypothetical protein
MKRALSLTLVEYPANEPLFGKAMALVSMAPLVLLVALSTLILYSTGAKRVGFALTLLGLLLSEAVNAILKRAIKEPRPPGRMLARSGV